MEGKFDGIYMNHSDNGMKKNIVREKPKKMLGPSVQGIVKTQLEVV